MENELILKQIERELRQYFPVLLKAADAILDQEVSKYPIFIVHQGELELGIPIIEKEKSKGSWSVNVSILEEFAAKKLIQVEKIDNFRTVYKDPDIYLCLFVLSEIGANFIFLPRKDIQSN